MEVPYSRGWGPGGARPFRLSHTHTLYHTLHTALSLSSSLFLLSLLLHPPFPSLFLMLSLKPTPPIPLVSFFFPTQLQLDFKGHLASRKSWMFSRQIPQSGRLGLWNSCLPLFRNRFCPFGGPCHNCQRPPPPSPSPALSKGPVCKLSLAKNSGVSGRGKEQCLRWCGTATAACGGLCLY